MVEELKTSYPAVMFYDPTNILCNRDGSCDIQDDKKLLYFDATHMSPLASLKVLKAMESEGYVKR